MSHIGVDVHTPLQFSKTTLGRLACAIPSMQRLNNFTRWSVEKRISFAGVRPQIGPAGNGLFATFPISPGTKLVQVPKQTTLTVRKEAEPLPKGSSVELQRV